MSLDTTIRDLCAKHDLTSISLSFHWADTKHCSAFVHWLKDGEMQVSYETADNSHEAIAKAISSANVLRQEAVHVPELEAA